MSRLQHLFLLIAIPIGLVQSWDIAITIGDQIQFYPKQNQTGSEGTQFRDLTALAYDAVHNILLFVEKQSDNASIFSYNLTTKKYQSLVKRRPSENIQGVAFDPVNGLIFWTDFNERSIFYISLTHGSENNFYGKLLIKMDDDLPRGIAVDSCRGYIYWTNTNNTRPTIERARFDGSERKVIVNTNLFMPVSLAIDQRTKRLYWADDKEGIHYSIESSDLDGNDRITLLSGIDHYPNSITVSKDSIYWVDWGYHKIWTIPKTPSGAVKPQQYISFDNEPFGVVANYTIEDQIEGIPECEILADLYKNKTPFDDTYNVPADAGLFCVHGVKIFDKLECKCTAGYTGDRCDISVCNNYCYRGRCNVTGEGKPMCSCEEGFTGIRCEIEMCHNYCLNKGICTINDKKDPVCACSGDFEGSRCESLKPSPTVSTPKPLPTTERITTDTQSLPEAVTCNCNEGNGSKKCETELCYNYCLNNGICLTNYKNEPVCTCSGDFEGSRCENVRLIPTSTTSKTVPTTVMTTTDMQPLPEITCNCTKENSTTLAATYNLDNVNEVYSLESSSCNDGWDTFSHPAFMVLAITCGLLCVVCVVLVTKIMQLKKRPRIKKRIIVNKNVTPMTARPDQCEITIENCCNMNICETPCFEPRSTIRPTLINSKSGKEEKKNLISNMEGPDDY